MISYLTSFLFGFCLFLGVVISSFLLWKKVKKNDLETEIAFDWFLNSLIAFLLIGRLAYILENLPLFLPDIFRWIHLVRYPGISGSGGFLGILLASFLFFRLKKVNAWGYLDAVVMAFLYGFFFATLGCLANTCIQGTRGSLPSFLSFLKIREFFHPVIIYSLTSTTILVVLFKRAGEIDFSKRLKKFFPEEKLPFRASGFYFLFFLFSFSITNLILAIFTTNALYFKNVNANVLYFIVLGLLSLLLIFKKIGFKNLGRMIKGVYDQNIKISQRRSNEH